MEIKKPKYKLKDTVLFLDVNKNDFYQGTIEGARLVGEYGSDDWIYYIFYNSEDEFYLQTVLLKEWVNEDNITKLL